MPLPESLYSAAQARELDRRATGLEGVSAAVLMARAGAAALALLRARFPRARRVAVVCGPGNNGGDGCVLARLARAQGLDSRVFAPETARAKVQARLDGEIPGASVQGCCTEALRESDLVVDALLGTGLERALEGEWRAAVETVNGADRPVLALDIPSGLHADSGAVLGAAVRADATISFVGLKAGLFTAVGREQAGEIYFDDLGVPASAYAGITPLARRITGPELAGWLRPRPRHAHKGDAGCVLIVGGGVGMPGAVRLAGEAACRSGAGLVMLATHPAHAAVIPGACPELIAYPASDGSVVRGLRARATVLAVGPGLGQGSWATELLAAALETGLPMVVDADALTLLAADPRRRDDWVLTPHPGEAARLLATTPERIQVDRFAAARAIVERYGGVCVLKGSGTLVVAQREAVVALCDRGNPGMASAGMGDVLTGVIAALRAQGLSAPRAARVGVWLHAGAADEAARARGEIGMCAGDLMPYLRAGIRRLVEG